MLHTGSYSLIGILVLYIFYLDQIKCFCGLILIIDILLISKITLESVHVVSYLYVCSVTCMVELGI